MITNFLHYFQSHSDTMADLKTSKVVDISIFLIIILFLEFLFLSLNGGLFIFVIKCYEAKILKDNKMEQSSISC